MNPYIISKEEKGYLLFTINRPDKRNAINYEIMDGLTEALDLASEPSIKGLVITGAGDGAFCSGGDLSVFHGLRTEEEAYEMLSKMAKILYRLLMFEKPTIAVINGAAVGGGCELAAACDFRFAKKGIKAGFVQGNLGITSGWGGGTMLLEKIPASNALQMLMEADVYHTDQLLKLGFIKSVYEEDEHHSWHSKIENLLHLESGVLQAYKKLLIEKWEKNNLWERIENEVRRCAVLWESDNHHEQVELFRNRK